MTHQLSFRSPPTTFAILPGLSFSKEKPSRNRRLPPQHTLHVCTAAGTLSPAARPQGHTRWQSQQASWSPLRRIFSATTRTRSTMALGAAPVGAGEQGSGRGVRVASQVPESQRPRRGCPRRSRWQQGEVGRRADRRRTRRSWTGSNQGRCCMWF